MKRIPVRRPRATPLRLTHLRENGEIHMVDISGKGVSWRTAVATGRIVVSRQARRLIAAQAVAKGNVLATARLAGIQAAKQTSQLIPLCHQLALHHVEIDFKPAATGFEIRATVKTQGQTGAEMEALTAVSVAALTIYDMCKAVDKAMVIEAVRLVAKEKVPVRRGG